MKVGISQTYNINVSIGQCRSAKRLALSEIQKTLQEHYSKLWDYGAEIRMANRGSKVQMIVDPQPTPTNDISSHVFFRMETEVRIFFAIFNRLYIQSDDKFKLINEFGQTRHFFPDYLQSATYIFVVGVCNGKVFPSLLRWIKSSTLSLPRANSI